MWMDEEYKSINIELGRHALDLARQEWGGLQSIEWPLRTLVDQPGQSCEVAGNWYVVVVEYQQERLAKSEIALRGMIPYFPLSPRRERHGRGATRTAWRPMLGPYAFVRCLPRQWSLVSASRGVRRFLGQEGVPQSVEPHCLEVIRLIEAEDAETERHRGLMEAAAVAARAKGRSGIVWDYSEGERVRIKNGPFAGFYAHLRAAVDVHDRIRAVMDIFGTESAVELSAFDVEKAV